MLYAMINDSRLQCMSVAHVPILASKLHSHGLSKTPEGVAIWLALQSTHPSVTMPEGVWHHADPLNRKERFQLAKVLSEATSGSSLQSEQQAVSSTGHWSPKIHFAWQVVISHITTSSSAAAVKSKSPKSLSFEQFWPSCVDGAYVPLLE